ncbi:hypothetical protein M9H77_21564 [Catharanthus roseus]|uniref:Uncharacterized protein n=1 Tax=Catharanthus roseus TaxID=4058 RepID=A0ACC0ANP6_CATRO|nr:hypothetical protein M9H77_21564 [Catharanthus roseus]
MVIAPSSVFTSYVICGAPFYTKLKYLESAVEVNLFRATKESRACLEAKMSTFNKRMRSQFMEKLRHCSVERPFFSKMAATASVLLSSEILQRHANYQVEDLSKML